MFFPIETMRRSNPSAATYGQQDILARKVAIGGIVRYLSAPRHLAQREYARADLPRSGSPRRQGGSDEDWRDGKAPIEA